MDFIAIVPKTLLNHDRERATEWTTWFTGTKTPIGCPSKYSLVVIVHNPRYIFLLTTKKPQELFNFENLFSIVWSSLRSRCAQRWLCWTNMFFFPQALFITILIASFHVFFSSHCRTGIEHTMCRRYGRSTDNSTASVLNRQNGSVSTRCKPL